MDTTPESTCSNCGSWWRLPVLLGLVLAAIVGSRFWPAQTHPKPDNAPQAEEGPRQYVSVTIDYGDGRTKDITDIAWSPGMTVADVLSGVPTLQVQKKGSDEGALLTSIDDAANEGTSGKNWTFSVNNQLADRSFAVYELRAGDHLLWTFGPQR